MTVHALTYETERLSIGPWHTWADRVPDMQLGEIVRTTLTDAVTAPLPPSWQGDYDEARATAWIEARDAECVSLLAIQRDTQAPVGLVLLFAESTTELRLGYLLREDAWGRGYASELIAGLVEACAAAGVQRIQGGVAVDNAASARVLE
ncbi:MAG: GNAT family N-acetyltransferase, partial [Pseudomonadota bacterium]